MKSFPVVLLNKDCSPIAQFDPVPADALPAIGDIATCDISMGSMSRTVTYLVVHKEEATGNSWQHTIYVECLATNRAGGNIRIVNGEIGVGASWESAADFTFVGVDTSASALIDAPKGPTFVDKGNI